MTQCVAVAVAVAIAVLVFFSAVQACRVKKKASINKTVWPIFQNITLETHSHTRSHTYTHFVLSSNFIYDCVCLSV